VAEVVIMIGKLSVFEREKQRVIIIKEKLTSIYFESKQRYGGPIKKAELNFTGRKVFRITMVRYINKLGLRIRLTIKFRIATNSTHHYLVVQNVLDRAFLVADPAKAWVSDSTYIHTKEGFLYLTTVLDLYDRKIIGWSLSDGMNTEETAIAALKMAVTDRTPEKGLIFHSDRGIQYACKRRDD
jgi:transposase InsO family protein